MTQELSMDPASIIAALGMTPHPEGGWYREHWRDGAVVDGVARGHGSAIYYLLEEGQASHWHRIDGVEIWHFYAGAALHLGLSAVSDQPAQWHLLGPDLTAGQAPQIVIPDGAWQSAEARDGWTLVGCTVSPGFTFDGFELAPPHWQPGDGEPAPG